MKIKAINEAGTGSDNGSRAETDISHRELLELSARFSHLFTRWLEAKSPGGLSYPRLRLLEALHCQGPAKMKTLGDTLGSALAT